jgi:quinone-modifying oxidoreductase subunit QmoC
MSEFMVEPDLNFIKGLTASGAESVKKCYQCATCSVVCNIAPEGTPFPRKEMVWAQWGLKDKLAADADVWLCHNCGDCTTHCPRGAKPAEVLGTLRKATIEKYAMIKPLAAIGNNFIAQIIVAAIVIAGLLAASGSLNMFANYHQAGEDGKLNIIFNNFVPTHNVDFLFVPLFMLGVLTAGYGIMKFWNDICENAKLGRLTGRNALPSILPTIVQIFKHDVFANCGVNKDRKIPHLLALLSFIALFITTNWAVFYLYVLGWEPGSYSSLANPLKWLGNIGAVMLIVGTVWLIKNRKAKEATQTSSSFDWNLLYLILLIGITGFVAQVFRIGGAYVAAQVTYVLHLIFIAQLFIFAPYSKLAHLFYRTTAMVFARHTGRNLVTTPYVAPAAPAAATETEAA